MRNNSKYTSVELVQKSSYGALQWRLSLKEAFRDRHLLVTNRLPLRINFF
jgi:hypothetical protein